MSSQGIIVEACCTTPEAVTGAFANGVDRVELCCALDTGGLTPSHGLMQQALQLRREARAAGRMFNVHALIRPREGDFVYNDAETDVMVADILHCKSLGLDGVVIGALTPEGDIDQLVMRRLMEAAKGMSVTFHRAFDECKDPEGMLEEVIALGCDRLLTSGCAPSAPQGADTIAKLVKQGAGRIIILAGAGIGPDNMHQFVAYTGVAEVHGSRFAKPCK